MTPNLNRIKERWQGPGGCRQVLHLAFPLILSTGTSTIQMFIDRVFLTWHSTDTMSAAMPAGITAFVFISFFMGTGNYVNTFVAQYTGANRPWRVGPAVWQGIYFSLLAGIVMIAVIPLAESIFRWFDHAHSIQVNEVIYFKVLCYGMTPTVLTATVSCFFTGRGKTWIVLYLNLVATLINIALDYYLIFDTVTLGPWHFAGAGMGIAGAGWATVIAATVSAALFLIAFLKKKYRTEFASLSGFKPDLEIFKRLMKYGLPNGVQFCLDMTSFALFVAFVGRINATSLAATNIAFQINMLAFMPMIGLGIALSTLVGQALGKNNPTLAARSTWSALYMTTGYMSLIALGFWLIPGVFIFAFKACADPGEFAAIEPIVKTLLCFVAFYCIFDSGNIIFSAALKGAGDTRFVMCMTVSLSWIVMVLPTIFIIKNQWGPGNGLYLAWGFASAYVCLLAILFLLRFLNGKWKTMRVIEQIPPSIPTKLPEIPTIEVEST